MGLEKRRLEAKLRALLDIGLASEASKVRAELADWEARRQEILGRMEALQAARTAFPEEFGRALEGHPILAVLGEEA